jgi:hypothetical protein
LKRLEEQSALSQELTRSYQLSLFGARANPEPDPMAAATEIITRLREMDTSAITPLTALNLLEELKKIALA